MTNDFFEDALQMMAQQSRDLAAMRSPSGFAPETYAWELFHRAWSRNVGREGYDKQLWLWLEDELSAADAELRRR